MFPGIFGYEETVIPELQRAILAGHHINLLGLRGQAKTRIARLLINLLDEYMPVVAGSELNDDPLQPLSVFAKNLIAENGDDTPVAWLPRADRYTEKLATPDVSVADLIGDADPIKAATLKLPYSDERVIHFGLIPRAHRGIFVINELPDLQARIQVSLFNILQEGDIQIRGFKVRLPLDIQFVFTANPEDYTNRGSIVTPLKDRIDAQIITHYPKSIEIGKRITKQEARIKDEQQGMVTTNEIIARPGGAGGRGGPRLRVRGCQVGRIGPPHHLGLRAGDWPGPSAGRCSTAKSNTYVRVGDFISAVPAITGKVELVYEGEQEGAGIVAEKLMGKAIRTLFLQLLPRPRQVQEAQKPPLALQNGAGVVRQRPHRWTCCTTPAPTDYRTALDQVPGLRDIVTELHPNEDARHDLFPDGVPAPRPDASTA